MNRVHVTKIILWTFMGIAAAAGLTRFLFGLGAITNLTDSTPWGLWVGFDVMGGVALAAGGFVMTAIFYVMQQEDFHPMVKPAVLTAFLGYLAVILSLLVDLGLPWNIWHLMVYWNPHSPLFEVGWCVMLYTTVLLLEFSPVPLEETGRWNKIRRVLMKFRFPLVLLGIMLSTLHQSSLGSLFLIMPFKSHPLWYTNILPILFFISAVGLGLMVVSFENLFSAWVYRRNPETVLVSKLCKAAMWVLSLYLLIRMGDIIVKGKSPLIFSSKWASVLFFLELLIMAVIPIVLFAIPRFRMSVTGQWIGSIMVVFGMVFNRINVGGLTMMGNTGEFYFPSWMELAVSAGIISAMILIFLFALERFHIWEDRPTEPEAAPHAKPEFSRSGEVWLGSPGVAARTKYSLAFVLALAVGFALMPGGKIHGKGITDVPALKARGGDTLWIDGNRDGYGVAFAHATHVEKLGAKQSCSKCHHLNLPSDKESGCYECHSRMYRKADMFKHDWHGSPDGANIRCRICHDPHFDRSASGARACDGCHKDMVSRNTSIEIKSYMVPSYIDALHDMCVACHTEKAKELEDKPNLAVCSTCHSTTGPDYLRDEIKKKLKHPHYNRVVLPGLKLQSAENRME